VNRNTAIIGNFTASPIQGFVRNNHPLSKVIHESIGDSNQIIESSAEVLRKTKWINSNLRSPSMRPREGTNIR
jgi:hypothetical protein